MCSSDKEKSAGETLIQTFLFFLLFSAVKVAQDALTDMPPRSEEVTIIFRSLPLYSFCVCVSVCVSVSVCLCECVCAAGSSTPIGNV